jgi:hypothetical protein
MRGFNKHAAWGSNYEFEDVISSVDDVDLFTLEPETGHRVRNWVARRMIWKPGVRHLTRYLNPGLKRVTLRKDYDLFVFVCMNPADLIYLSAIDGWRDRCARKLCFMVEFYAGWTREYAYHLSLLKMFDHVALSFSSSVAAVREATGQPCHAVPLGVDAIRYGPYPDPPRRCIDVYSMGRRVEALHERLLAKAAARELFYVYDTLPGALVQPHDHVQHRELVGNFAKRSRLFVAFPAKVDAREETRGQSEVGARFFEGAAAGAVLIGHAPTVPAFARDFHWPDALVDVSGGGQQLQGVLDAFASDSERFRTASRRNVVAALRGFDWVYRWRQILQIVDFQPTPLLAAREQQLARLASLVEDQ